MCVYRNRTNKYDTVFDKYAQVENALMRLEIGRATKERISNKADDRHTATQTKTSTGIQTFPCLFFFFFYLLVSG